MNGGTRPGAGRKPGGKNQKTIEKEIALEEFRQGIMQEVQPMLRSALNSAIGITVMYQRRKVKNKLGKYERTGELIKISDQSRVEELLHGKGINGEDYYYITTKEPNISAVKELWDRAFGRPKETVEPEPVIPPNPYLSDIRAAIARAYRKRKEADNNKENKIA